MYVQPPYASIWCLCVLVKVSDHIWLRQLSKLFLILFPRTQPEVAESRPMLKI